jgi:hypothetical protein
MSSSPNQGSPQGSRRGSTDISGNAPRKFMNGWTKEQENLMAEWSDKAGCYRWLHDRCEKKYSQLNMFITIPVIILSTLTGTANFALDGFIPADNQDMKKYAQAGIGAVSIFAGILTTLGNFLRFAQGSESHRVAGISWGKFQRQIAVELAIHPNERIDAMDFLKICRAEMDRLIEQAPPIPDDIIKEFLKEFKDKKEIKRPEVVGGLEHTHVFEDRAGRLKLITAEASLTLLHKKKILRNEIVPDLDRMIRSEVDRKLSIVENKLQDLSGVVISKLKGAGVTPDDGSAFQYQNPLRKVKSLQEIDWDALSKKRLTTTGHNTMEPASTSNVFITIRDPPKTVQQQQRTEVVTPIETQEEDA